MGMGLCIKHAAILSLASNSTRTSMYNTHNICEGGMVFSANDWKDVNSTKASTTSTSCLRIKLGSTTLTTGRAEGRRRSSQTHSHGEDTAYTNKSRECSKKSQKVFEIAWLKNTEWRRVQGQGVSSQIKKRKWLFSCKGEPTSSPSLTAFTPWTP